MKILYLMTAPPPPLKGTDAAFQEVSMLRERFGGEKRNLCPFGRPRERFPRFLYGLHRLPSLRKAAGRADVLHIFHAEPYLFPVLSLLNRPVIYSVIGGLEGWRHPLSRRAFRRVRAFVVTTEHDRSILISRGFDRVEVVRPGIDTSRFHFSSCAAEEAFPVLFGSAPWTPGQFRRKGVDTALAALERDPALRLVFLWRGVMTEELQRRIRPSFASRLEVVDRQCDVNTLLGGVCAAAVLARDPGLVKAFPHSLIESLAAGKPVMVSRSVPMAEYVIREQCGVVVPSLETGAFLEALQDLRENYRRYQGNALRVGKRDFSAETFLGSFENLYRSPGLQH